MTSTLLELNSMKPAASGERPSAGRVLVAGAGWSADELRALSALAAPWGFSIRAAFDGSHEPASCVIERGTSSSPGRAAVATLRFVSNPVPISTTTQPFSDFSRESWLPGELQGQRVGLPASDRALPPGGAGNARPLLTLGGLAVWSLQCNEAAGAELVEVATPLPRMEAAQAPCEIFNGEKFFDALPVWLFFRSQALKRDAGSPPWNRPPLRACLVVDDPNLHTTRYGHIGYAALVARTREWGFHVAMATVPLDQWGASRAAAALFRDHPESLSLLVHGNDHTRGELASHTSPPDCAALALQSLARIAAMERRTGVAVDRVMAPPHGVVSPAMLDALASAGFDGVSTNRWSLWKHIPATDLGAGAGFDPAIWFPSGISIVNRYRFNSPIGKQEALFAALMGQPILPYGHHQDFSGDMAAVRRAVEEVNAIGDVQWMSMRRIFETSCEWRVEKDTLHLRPSSRRVVVSLPRGIARIQLEVLPGGVGPESFTARWCGGVASGETVLHHEQPLAVPRGAASVELSASPSGPGAGGQPARRNTPLRVRLRRLASEVRDRMKL